MDEHNFKRYEKLYEQIFKSYLNGELDLSDYFVEDNKVKHLGK